MLSFTQLIIRPIWTSWSIIEIGDNMKNLKSIRKKRGFTQSEVAKHLNIAPTSYSKYERGERNPDPDTLKRLSEFLDISVDYIIGNTDIPLTLAQVRFDKEVDHLSDEELFEKYDMTIDGKKVSKEEIKKMLAAIRALGE